MSNYYEDNAEEFFTSTKDVDMTPLYDKFLPYIPEGGHILDAGCGSGRDSKYFLSKDYKVTAIEPAKNLCALASKHIGQTVEQRSFEDIIEVEAYDAIWACASLLHVPRAELPTIFENLFASLKPSGVIYCSFKLGTAEREKDGRFFCDLVEADIPSILHPLTPESRYDIWITQDRRGSHFKDQWLNALIKK